MKSKPIHIGSSSLKSSLKTVKGEMTSLDGELFYRISNYDRMKPFFMSIVSDSDHWMFIWSNGALSAGRRNADNALFPYSTDDKIMDSAEITGSKTILMADANGKRCLWEPFSFRYEGLYDIDRNCYKNVYGNKLIFEEINHDLKLTFSYAWMNSERFGFIKRARIINHGDRRVSVELVDGIQNLLAYGINQRFQMEYSTLADAYKKSELEPDTGLGIYSLSSIPADKAEPSEAMKATVVWSAGIEARSVLVCSRQLDAFRRGQPVKQETDVRAARSAYFVNTELALDAGDEKTWYFAADINIDSAGVSDLMTRLEKGGDRVGEILEDVHRGTGNLIKTVANADGLQKTADTLSTSRHFANVLFNIMRGGIFADDYRIDTRDFARFLQRSHQTLREKHRPFLDGLPESLDFSELIRRVSEQNDRGLEKLGYEYLPLTFSRRHGDPSRPWNRFSIDIKDEYGRKNLNYQGNWRDIFQNWEALALSFPEYIESMITKFVNASTADGYNPYRVERDGFDWEVIDPDDAWSYIGYWGDHQIIYLLKLLELSRRFHPGRLDALLARDIFAYADVPYRIKPYESILVDPHNTVDFDMKREKEIEKRVDAIGSDGKFIQSEAGEVYRVNLTEKLLVPVLVKLSNFIPEAGIWMNTQRPEWNDANNALVGYGVSMVTLYYLRRHLAFFRALFSSGKDAIPVSREVAAFFSALNRIFSENRDLLMDSVSDRDRKRVLDGLGAAGSDYRMTIYARGFSGERQEISPSEIAAFCQTALDCIDHTIRANRRDDGLYHAYNLMKVQGDTVSIRTLYEMLEGQTAVLSSGLLSPQEVLHVLDALKKSPLWREDQATYLLYPDRKLPRFTEKNNIPAAACEQSRLIQTLLEKGDKRIVVRDARGGVHFNGAFRNAAMLKQALSALDPDEMGLPLEEETELILEIYESMFDHQSFTGRSGSFFKYEGLGSTYWHMVSKLLLAVQECYSRAARENASQEILDRLSAHYYEIRHGIGVTKSPDVYGAFPTDPYSHTPAHAGVQQPGMTGQVKEDVLSRFGELGVVIEEGAVHFRPGLLRREEFLAESAVFSFVDLLGKEASIDLKPGTLAFTLAQVPVVYHQSDDEKTVVTRQSGKQETLPGLGLDAKTSQVLFRRSGEITRIDVSCRI